MSEARLLVIGYQGTLRPIQQQKVPPVFEMLLQPWVEHASALLSQRIPLRYCIFQGEPVPLDSLLALLRDKLLGILVQAVNAIGNASEDLPASNILREFPLLSPLMRQTVSEWAGATGTFLQRLHRDQGWLAAKLPGGRLPPIKSIRGAASDIHPGGHSVLRVCFHGGGCLYYKPRPLTGEWLWHGLLTTIAALDAQLSLPAARVFTREADTAYGWATSVLPGESFWEASSATANYWHVAGAMLCLAQHARLTDLHLGNILASPGGPTVTDAECFATPVCYHVRDTTAGHCGSGLCDALGAILATGLLPGKQASTLPDVSGLFGHAACVAGIRIPAWSLSSGGRYELEPVGAELVDHGNAPARTTPVAVLPQLLSGYRHAAHLLIRARTTLLAPGSQWRSVLEEHHAPRFVLRDTLAYGCLMSQSLEPQSLRSSYRRRNATLTVLQSSPDPGFSAAVLRAECNAILRLHVPRFTILSGSRNLATGRGRAVARRFASLNPAQTVLHSIESLTPASIDSLHVPALLAAIL